MWEGCGGEEGRKEVREEVKEKEREGVREGAPRVLGLAIACMPEQLGEEGQEREARGWENCLSQHQS